MSKAIPPQALHQRYFERHQGQWCWRLEIAVVNWPAFWRENWSLRYKLRFLGIYLTQRLLGGYTVHTALSLQGHQVFHRTRMHKWGFTLYLSEKSFALATDGWHLSLTGHEYLWPRLKQGLAIEVLAGEVLSEQSARYEMPFMRLICRCTSHLGGPDQRMELTNPWLKLDLCAR